MALCGCDPISCTPDDWGQIVQDIGHMCCDPSILEYADPAWMGYLGYSCDDVPAGDEWPPACFADQWDEITQGCYGGDFCMCDLGQCDYHGQEQYEFCRNC